MPHRIHPTPTGHESVCTLCGTRHKASDRRRLEIKLRRHTVDKCREAQAVRKGENRA